MDLSVIFNLFFIQEKRKLQQMDGRTRVTEVTKILTMIGKNR